jgi:hypothetical protein
LGNILRIVWEHDGNTRILFFHTPLPTQQYSNFRHGCHHIIFSYARTPPSHKANHNLF